MRTLFLFSLCLFMLKSLRAQNLIPNPSFEDENICTEHDASCAPAGWITPSPYLPEYRGRNGEKHIALIAFNSSKPGVRQYVQTQLMCPLKAGEVYNFSIELKQDECILGSIGVLFTDSLIYTDRDELLSVKPTIDLSDQIASYSKRKQKNWISVQTTYKATGNEKYVLIGNFQTEQEQNRDYAEEPKNFKSYRYSIDQVSLTDPKTDTLCEHAEAIKNHWYSYNIRHSQIRIKEYVPEPEAQPTLQVIEPEVPKMDSLRLSDVIFEFNSAKLNDEAKAHIQTILSTIDLTTIDEVQIEGHTDNVGTPEYNLTLSEQRAQAVKNMLISMGIDENSILTEGKGDQVPVADNTTEEGRRKNRRIELFIQYK